MRFNLDVEGDLIFAKNVRYRPVERPDLKLLPAEQHEKFYAVQTMISMLGVKDPPAFFVMLFKYYIEGEPYMASGLTVSPGHTPNIRQTPTGFECDTFFEPHMLTDHAQKGKEVVNGVMKVRMKVELEDIRIIVGKLSGGKGGQINLYGVG
jgi:hypothetical protein